MVGIAPQHLNNTIAGDRAETVLVKQPCYNQTKMYRLYRKITTYVLLIENYFPWVAVSQLSQTAVYAVFISLNIELFNPNSHQMASEEVIWSGSRLYAIQFVNLWQDLHQVCIS